MPNVSELGKLVKQKYPGSYDSMDDVSLGKMVQQKYPGSYDQYSAEPAVKASLSATQLAPGVPIPGMPQAPKVNMQYHGPIPQRFADIRYATEEEVAAAKQQDAADFYAGRAAQPGQSAMEQGYSQMRDAKSGSDVAMGASNFARGFGQGMAPVMLASLGGSVASIPGTFNKLKAVGQVFGGAVMGGAAGAGAEAGLQAMGVPDGYAQAGGDVASIVAPAGAFKLYDYLAGKLPTIGPFIKNKNTPQRQEQMDMLQNMGVQLDVGQANNNNFARRVAQGSQSRLGSSGMAQDFYQAQERQLADASKQVVSSATPNQNYPPAAKNASAEAYPTGQGLIDKINGRITTAKSYADKMYDSVRQTAARNVKDVQVGTKDIPASTILDEFGHPARPATTVPVIASVESPVDLTKIRPMLQSIYQDLSRSLPPVQQQSNPAFNALKSLMESSDAQMPAVDFDKFLGAVKAITRNGTNPLLTNQSQGLAKQIVKQGEVGLRDALAQAGPSAVTKLERGRAAVKSYYETADFLSGLKYEEPAALYSQLTTGGDKVANALKTAQTYAPSEVSQIGRTFLQGMFDKATQQGGFNRMDGVLSDWNKMGPETKKILFGAKTVDVEKFILAAKDIGKVYNPSGTAAMQAVDAVLRSTPLAISTVTGNPLPLAAEGAYLAGNRQVGKILLDPRNKSLTSLLELNKLMRRPMSTADYYRTGAPVIPMALRGATK